MPVAHDFCHFLACFLADADPFASVRRPALDLFAVARLRSVLSPSRGPAAPIRALWRWTGWGSPALWIGEVAIAEYNRRRFCDDL